MADAARTARAAALEDKKRRLEELKARRARRETTASATQTPRSANLDEYIDGLLSQPGANQPTTATAAVEESEPAAAVEQAPSTGTTTPATGTTTPVEQPVVAAPPAPLQKQVQTFEFGTQTLDDDFPVDQEDEDAVVLETNDKADEDAEADTATPDEIDVEVEPKVLTSEEKEETVGKVPFSSFLNTASKKVERILGEPVLADLLVNFVGETDGDDTTAKTASDGSKYVAARQVFEHSKWTTGRNVTDLDWSTLHRELLLSSYDATGAAVSGGLLTAVSPDVPPSASLAPRSGELQADGLALVWNLAMPSRPEHVFTCGSPVSCARFHPTEAPLLLGACQSGQLVIWDIRAGRLPVQRSGQGYPMSALEVMEGNSGLVTTSTDGKVGFWSLANLQNPVETVQLAGNLSCVATSPNNVLVCGDESGVIFSLPTKRKQVKKIGEPHFGMVTAVSTKKKFVLSTGVDWTVRLTKGDKAVWSSVSHTYDYMSDVQWNPLHPSLFATASSNGTVGLWNLAESLDAPCGEIVVEQQVGLNKVRWSADGRRMLVAAGERVHVLSLADDVVRQKGDEEDRMMELLS